VFAVAALMQATHQAAGLLAVAQAIPPEPPLVLVGSLLRQAQQHLLAGHRSNIK
jgi:hypothetical protein